MVRKKVATALRALDWQSLFEKKTQKLLRATTLFDITNSMNESERGKIETFCRILKTL